MLRMTSVRAFFVLVPRPLPPARDPPQRRKEKAWNARPEIHRMSRTPPPPLDGAIFLLGTAATVTTATRSNAVGHGLGDAPADDA
jgi:hypothetical protein